MNAPKQILKWALITIISFTSFNLFISSKYKVERSVKIDDPENIAYGEVADLKLWKNWSGWLKNDNTMTIEYDGQKNGKYSVMKWKELESEGSLEIVKSSLYNSINIEMSLNGMLTSYGFWTFEKEGVFTNVTCIITGEIPFYMSFMTLFIDEDLGEKLEMDLADLKRNCELKHLDSFLTINLNH